MIRRILGQTLAIYLAIFFGISLAISARAANPPAAPARPAVPAEEPSAAELAVTPAQVAREVEQPPAAIPAGSEYVIICGGPAMRTWENAKRHPHDNTWANFISAAEVRWKQIKANAKPGDVYTWLVYRKGYEHRSGEDKTDHIKGVENIAKTLGVKLKWFGPSYEVVDHINSGYPRDQVKIANLDYFGHSNRNCWMFDYSNDIDGCSDSFLHNKDLPTLNSGSFLPNAHVKSWGCHSAESFCYEWERATGTKMIGTVGKTDYSTGGLPKVTRAPGWSAN